MSNRNHLTLYSSSNAGPDADTLMFTRTASGTIGELYALFVEFSSMEQNEALLGALADAVEDRISFFRDTDGFKLIVKGEFPAISLEAHIPIKFHQIPEPSVCDDPFIVTLARQRIAYTPRFFHGYFVNGKGETLDPSEESDIDYASSTGAAVRNLAEIDIFKHSAFFGKEYMEKYPLSEDFDINDYAEFDINDYNGL